MSWNKNTINISQLDTTVNFLKKEDRSYKLTNIGEVRGLGLNDDGNHMLRRLEYQATTGQIYVVLEKMIRTSDCDSDDHIVSKEFKKEQEPKTWELEERIEND